MGFYYSKICVTNLIFVFVGAQKGAALVAEGSEEEEEDIDFDEDFEGIAWQTFLLVDNC